MKLFNFTTLNSAILNIAIALVAMTLSSSCFAENKANELAHQTQNSWANKVKKEADVKIGGFLQWDYDYFDGLYNEDNIGSEVKLRRARLILKGQLVDNFRYVLMPNYNNAKKQVDLLNAFISYQGFDKFDLTVGRFKEPFGMEALSSALWTPTIERSLIASKPNPISAGLFIDAGIMASKRYKKLTWALAIVDDQIEDKYGKDLYGVTGRLTYAPILDKRRLLHLGIAHAHRSTEENTAFRINGPFSVATAKKVTLLNTQIEGLSQTGLELALRYGAFSLQNEYILSQTKNSELENEPDVKSYYTMLTYTLTGEHRRYSGGVFSNIVPNKKSAFELVAKFENNHVDTGTSAIAKAKAITLGANYYISKDIKLSLNYIDSSTSNLTAVEDGRAISARFQFKF